MTELSMTEHYSKLGLMARPPSSLNQFKLTVRSRQRSVSCYALNLSASSWLPLSGRSLNALTPRLRCPVLKILELIREGDPIKLDSIPNLKHANISLPAVSYFPQATSPTRLSNNKRGKRFNTSSVFLYNSIYLVQKPVPSSVVRVL